MPALCGGIWHTDVRPSYGFAMAVGGHQMLSGVSPWSGDSRTCGSRRAPESTLQRSRAFAPKAATPPQGLVTGLLLELVGRGIYPALLLPLLGIEEQALDLPCVVQAADGPGQPAKARKNVAESLDAALFQVLLPPAEAASGPERNAGGPPKPCHDDRGWSGQRSKTGRAYCLYILRRINASSRRRFRASPISSDRRHVW